MSMFNNEPTKISLSHGGKTHTSELNWDADMYDMLQAFYGLCVASSWNPEQVVRGMYEFVQEVDVYNWTEINSIENGPEEEE